MKFEDKVNLGKEAITQIKKGVPFDQVMGMLCLGCGMDTALSSILGDIGVPSDEDDVKADPLEVLILGANEKAIEDTANELVKAIKDNQDGAKLEEYKQMVANVKTLADKIGNPEIVGNFLPIDTLLGSAMIRAGERLMGIEGTNRAAEKDEDNKEEK